MARGGRRPWACALAPATLPLATLAPATLASLAAVGVDVIAESGRPTPAGTTKDEVDAALKDFRAIRESIALPR